MPPEQEPHEVLCGERFDLSPQASHGQTVDPLQEPPVTPLELLCARAEHPTEDLTLGLEAMKGERHVVFRQCKGEAQPR
jgi:hypothetical protein